MKVLKRRITTAFILALLFLGALFGASETQFSLIIAAVVTVAAWEWANLVGLKAQWQRWLYGLGIAAAIGLCGHYTQAFQSAAGLSEASVRPVLLVACTWWAIALLWVQGYPASAVLWGNAWIKGLMGLLVLLPTWLALTYLRVQAEGQLLVLMVVLVVACADVGAYFTGRAFGRRKLAVAVSPGKSWAGFWGGFACCLLLAAVAGYLLGDVQVWLTIVAPAALASVLGDLLESMVKRQRGIKDSSRLLPGHGGVLDRVDSITAAAPVFALAVLLSDWAV